MENWEQEMNDFHKAQREQIEKSVETPIEDYLEKARGGVYTNTAQNRKLGRVGQKYGGQKEDDSKKEQKGKKEYLNPKFTTEQLHKRNGQWTKERSSMHQKIFDKYMGQATTSEKPLAILIMGGSASGKGSASAELVNQLKREYFKDSVEMPKLDVDEIKQMLPEYSKFDPEVAAANTHKESSELGNMIRDELIESKANFVNDATFGDEKKAAKMVARLKAKGYNIKMVNVTIPIEEAKKREDSRYKETGRRVPADILEQTHKGGVTSYEKLKGQVDEHYMLSNDVARGSKPILVEANGKVHNQNEMTKFLNKLK